MVTGARARASLCIEVDRPDQMEAAGRWYLSWQDELTYVSADKGCGCCVHLFNVEGSEAAVSALPKEIVSSNAWSSGEGVTPKANPKRNGLGALFKLKAKDRRAAEQRGKRRG